MIIIDFIPEHSVIRFVTQYSGVYKNPSEDPRAFEENQRLRENLNRMGLNTLKRDLVFEESSGSLNWSRTAYHSSDYCFYVTADSFSSLNNIVEKVLDGFAEFKVAPGASFSSTDIKTYMYAFDSQTSLSAYRKQRLEEYYDHSVTPQMSNK